MKIVLSLLTLTALYANSLLAISFGPCNDASDDETLALSSCARIELPLDYPAINAETNAGNIAEKVELAIRKFPVPDPSKRAGQVWLIAGGPGEAGAAFYPMLEVFRKAFDGYDLIVPDHRGTGDSARLCPDQEAIDSEAGYALAGSEWGPCIGYLFANQRRTQAFTITNAAHDLAMLIEHYREPGKVHVYAVSYGTQLALRMLQVSDMQLDGLILDGLTPPESEFKWDLSQRNMVVDAVGRRLLDERQTQRFKNLLASESPVWQDVLNGGDIRQFMGSLLTFPALRERIPLIVDELAAGKTTLLNDTSQAFSRVYESLTPYPQSQPSLPLVTLISSSENNSRRDLTMETVTVEAKDALFTSPIPGYLTNTFVPLYEKDHYFGRQPEKLPRTLIVHGTLDPNTPYEGAIAHAELLKKVGNVQFSTITAGAHFLPLVAPGCFVQVVSEFMSTNKASGVCDAF